MVTIPKSPETAEEFIERLTDLKFGVNAPGVALSAQRRARYSKLISAPIMMFQQELRKLTTEELRSRYEAAIQEQRSDWQKQAEAEEAQRFYNQPYAAAHFDHWSRAAYWTLEEGVALSLGKDPKIVNLKKLEAYLRSSAFAHNYEHRYELAKRAAAVNLLGQTNIPGFFLGWAQRNGMELPADLVRLVQERGQSIADWPALLKEEQERHAKTIEWAKEHHAKALEIGKVSLERAMARRQADVGERDQLIAILTAEIERLKHEISETSHVETPINPKSRTSLLKLVLGMAIDGYGYDPRASRSPLPKELCDTFAALGILIDEDTIRVWLQEAAETIDASPSAKET